MEMKSMKLGEKLLKQNFTFLLAFSQPQSALYGNTWIYMAIQFCIVQTNNVSLLDVFSIQNVSLVLTGGSFCMLRNAAKVFDLLITDESILQLWSLTPRLIVKFMIMVNIHWRTALCFCVFTQVPWQVLVCTRRCLKVWMGSYLICWHKSFVCKSQRQLICTHRCHNV